MDYMKWNDELSVGIPSLDEEHKRLIGMINKIADAIQTTDKYSTIFTSAREMLSYVNTHFAHEEQLFDQFNYPDKVEHKRQHSVFIEKALSFSTASDLDKQRILNDLFMFLTEWWLEHVQNYDMKYSAFLKSKGVK